MAAITDLSWANLSDAFGPSPLNRPLLVANTDAYGTNILLDLGVLLGREISSTGSLGVIEAILKFREVCVIAQTAANQGKLSGEKLNSFAPVTFGTISNNAAPVTASIAAKIIVVPLGQKQIVGVNV